MLDPKFVLENAGLVMDKCAQRGVRIDLSEFLRLSEARKETLREVEDLRSRRNKASEEVAGLKRSGRDAAALIAETKLVGERIKTLEDGLKPLEERIRTTLLNIPNLPDESVPVGADASGNVEVRRAG
ncbi:MAG TPA: serine--tRNA ligase, partial [Candidatus Aminicenantes bacterium]|nr:serine--tRNA ligase [Candidatus Aminicenantes bacterium]